MMREPPELIPCWIYRSARNEEMYLYLRGQADFSSVPQPLLRRFGRPLLVMQLDLASDRTLARENVDTVLRNLRQRGYHLQLPPKFDPPLYAGD